MLVISCVTAQPVRAAFDETYKLEFGRSFLDFESKITINSPDNSSDKEIDLEEQLGVDPNVQLGFVKGLWRVAQRHRLSLLYMPIRRTSNLTTRNDILIDGNVVKAGAHASASFKTQVFDFEYLYSYYKRPDLELDVSVGVYWMSSLAEVSVSGEVLVEGSDQPEFRSNYESSQRLVAPLPLLGLSAGYEINPRWIAYGNARYFDVRVNEMEGQILSLTLKTEYYVSKRFALGASMVSFNLDVKRNGAVLSNTINYAYTGLQAYLVLQY